jgi:hypothetical protein
MATIGGDCHGIDRADMALERRFGFPRRQVPNVQRVVVGGSSDRLQFFGIYPHHRRCSEEHSASQAQGLCFPL